MANEKNTETIVRDHFRPYAAAGDVLLEEQQTRNVVASGLLKPGKTTTDGVTRTTPGASKSGPGVGRPDFFVWLQRNGKTDTDLVIIVECKPALKQHATAEAEAIWYSNHLAKKFDVLSIAVSGEDPNNLKISHFLQLRGEIEAEKILNGTLLRPADYRDHYTQSPQKYRQDYASLLDFATNFNQKLHDKKISEQKRALLLSCILIALEDRSFANPALDPTDSTHTYKTKSVDKGPQAVADYLVKTAAEGMADAKLPPEKLRTLENNYAFIKSDNSLSKQDGVLADIIEEVHRGVHGFMKTHEFHDTLGELYVEFLKYANSDKGLGIVLTPLHITRFMARLVRVDRNSVVYDNCTGTGGFLISAMGIMVENADGDKAKIAEIKRDQLVGVEFQDHIFALACSNMYIHQDGKSNIIEGNSFEDDVIRQAKRGHAAIVEGDALSEDVRDAVSEHKFTAGLLNPPYKDSPASPEELDFVLSNLACLERGARCAAIVPMSVALARSGKRFELKEKLLAEHTLEAVLSMPDELFKNSRVGVVTCIMLLTAHQPHPEHKETFFGYYKHDGFVNKKNRGRIDLNHVFEHEIEQKWLMYCLNNKPAAGFSVMRVVAAGDEWCAEAYMETDYSKLTRHDFEGVVKDYALYCLANGIIAQPATSPAAPTETGDAGDADAPAVVAATQTGGDGDE